MHQIRFRLGLRRIQRWGSLQRSHRAPSWISEVLLLSGRKEREGEKGEGWEERRGGEKRDGVSDPNDLKNDATGGHNDYI